MNCEKCGKCSKVNGRSTHRTEEEKNNITKVEDIEKKIFLIG